MGGLLARYVIGCVLSLFLHPSISDWDLAICPSCSILHQRKFFATVTPVNFNTIATPHIGLLRYPSLFSKLGSVIGPRFLSRTGEQFYGVDKWSKTGKALLEIMADPGKEHSSGCSAFLMVNPEHIFFQGLKLFPHIRIYANAQVPSSLAAASALIHCICSINDATVPYMTAYVDLEDPFLNRSTDGLTVYFVPQSTNMHTNFLLGIMMRNTFQSSNPSPYPTSRPPNAKPHVSSRGNGSNLIDHPFRLAFKHPFRLT